MTSEANKSTEPDIYCAVLDSGDMAVVRVIGRGSFLNSVPFKRFADHLIKGGHPAKFIVDLGKCETMDSTFMGVLASVSIAQSKREHEKVVAPNAHDHVGHILTTLGLSPLVEVNDSHGVKAAIDRAAAEPMLVPADNKPVVRIEQLLHTLEAHKTLV